MHFLLMLMNCTGMTHTTTTTPTDTTAATITTATIFKSIPRQERRISEFPRLRKRIFDFQVSHSFIRSITLQQQQQRQQTYLGLTNCFTKKTIPTTTHTTPTVM